MASMGSTERYPLEIINAGMYRGGTASLSFALQELGFGPTWHVVTNPDKLGAIGTKWWLENNIMDKLYNNEYVDFDEWLQQIQCRTLMDAPIIFFWDKIFAQYPKSKVIISVRDFDSWSKSYTMLLKHFVGVSMDLCKMTNEWARVLMNEWDRNHIGKEYNGVAQFLSLDESKRLHILREEYYDKQIQKAKEIVPKEQLLIFNPKDSWEPLCKFLNVAIPNKPFPNVNNTKAFNKFAYEWKKNVIVTMIINKMYYMILLLVVLIACIYIFF